MQQMSLPLGDPSANTSWLTDPVHRDWLWSDAVRQLEFFRSSLRADGGFDVLALDGSPLPDGPQELHTTTRMVHSYALGHLAGAPDCTAMIDAGMAFLAAQHRDPTHGGYVWSVANGAAADSSKLAYGHVFVLLAASSAKIAGHPDADAMIDDIAGVIDQHFWDDDAGLLRDEFTQDWAPFSTYRGMNSNMHGTEALLAAYEATGHEVYLNRAGRILDFFVTNIAPAHAYRLPEHYSQDWQVDTEYQGNPMFRPRGTTPGHSFELGRLTLQHWDLRGRPDDGSPDRARKLIETALADAWLPVGGFAYTLDYEGHVMAPDRYWWPVTEAIGALATLIKLGGTSSDEGWYRKLWQTASALFVDHERGGWFPEVDANGQPVAAQFAGKPDIYHALQADLIPMANGLSRLPEDLPNIR